MEKWRRAGGRGSGAHGTGQLSFARQGNVDGH